jgi:hypothetical protein
MREKDYHSMPVAMQVALYLVTVAKPVGASHGAKLNIRLEAKAHQPV